MLRPIEVISERKCFSFFEKRKLLLLRKQVSERKCNLEDWK